jgi:hypothetical protein
MMDRRRFLVDTGLKLTGFIAAAHMFDALPVAAAGPSYTAPAEPVLDLGAATRPSVARLRVREAGTYQISGLVRLDAPLVEISGITNSQQISWSGAIGSERPLAGFTSFEQFAGPGLTPEIQVRGGRLESISIVSVDYQ